MDTYSTARLCKLEYVLVAVDIIDGVFILGMYLVMYLCKSQSDDLTTLRLPTLLYLLTQLLYSITGINRGSL